MTLKNFKDKMIEKAIKNKGIWENFGQKELSKLKEKYHYNNFLKSDDCLDKKEIEIRNTINELDDWASHFDLSQLK